MLMLTACSLTAQRADVSYVARPMASGPRVAYLRDRSDLAFEIRRGYEASGSLTLLAGKFYDSYRYNQAFIPQAGWTAGPAAGPIMGFQYESGLKFLSSYASYELKSHHLRSVIDASWYPLNLSGVPFGIVGHYWSWDGGRKALFGPGVVGQAEIGDSSVCLYSQMWATHSLVRPRMYATLGVRDC